MSGAIVCIGVQGAQNPNLILWEEATGLWLLRIPSLSSPGILPWSPAQLDLMVEISCFLPVSNSRSPQLLWAGNVGIPALPHSGKNGRRYSSFSLWLYREGLAESRAKVFCFITEDASHIALVHACLYSEGAEVKFNKGVQHQCFLLASSTSVAVESQSRHMILSMLHV